MKHTRALPPWLAHDNQLGWEDREQRSFQHFEFLSYSGCHSPTAVYQLPQLMMPPAGISWQQTRARVSVCAITPEAHRVAQSRHVPDESRASSLSSGAKCFILLFSVLSNFIAAQHAVFSFAAAFPHTWKSFHLDHRSVQLKKTLYTFVPNPAFRLKLASSKMLVCLIWMTLKWRSCEYHWLYLSYSVRVNRLTLVLNNMN